MQTLIGEILDFITSKMKKKKKREIEIPNKVTARLIVMGFPSRVGK